MSATALSDPAVRGRFAPSPTGPLHFGSLVAAMGSWLDARCRGGQWLLRMEDLDRPRELPGAADAILRALEACGLQWDGAVLYQSRRAEAYEAALDGLRGRGLVYACACSRSEIAALQAAAGAIAAAAEAEPAAEPVYPGICRNGLAPGRVPRAWRARVGDAHIAFTDRVQGPQSQSLGEEVGDFVVRRADGPHAYQLAVVVDDAAQGVTDVVRGADLLSSTPRQILLQQWLGLATPRYAHLPVAVDTRGEKLSKQTHAPALDADHPLPAMLAALRFLGQEAPAELQRAQPREALDWARAHWRIDRVPVALKITDPSLA
jgi:glutamyl-Q tRNA(Asp) synthetase